MGYSAKATEWDEENGTVAYGNRTASFSDSDLITELEKRGYEVRRAGSSYISLVDIDVDGNGKDIETIARADGEVTDEAKSAVNIAIAKYKEEHAGEWDTDGCIDTASRALEDMGIHLEFISISQKISF